MMTVPLPDTEAERLEALRSLEILDTPPEESLDELTALAAYICQAPMAIISLIDGQRQWFKSKIGVSLCETPREVSFCAQTILQRDLLVIVDARADPRFANNPLVTSAPGIRFYAGAPLVTPQGHALGALCVIDHQPRELSAEQRRALRTLSRVVVTQLGFRRDLLERKRVEEALRVAQARLDFAIRASNIGIWEVEMPSGDQPNGSVTFLNCWEPLGYDPGQVLHDPPGPYRFVHADDRERLERVTADYLSGATEEYETEYRLRHRDGSYRWTLARGVAERDESGKPTRIIGGIIDITDIKRAEAALREAK